MKFLRKINPQKDLGKLFILISAGCILFTLIALYLTQGEIMSDIFWFDRYDTGMDFFHSIEYVRGRIPYSHWGTLYPPLANLLFYLFFKFVPAIQYEGWENTYSDSVDMRGDKYDLRTWQNTMVLFIVFCIVTAVLIFVFVRRIINFHERAGIIAFFALFTYGVLYAYERGNIVLIILCCCFFFVMYRNSENRILRELALIALAVAFGLKLYPAFFGMLLLYDKQYFRAIRTAIYGLLLFFLPFLAFHEGFSGISLFFETLFSWNGGYSIEIYGLEFAGFSGKQIVNSFILIARHFFEFEITGLETIDTVATMCARVMAVVALVCGFFTKKEWARLVCCCLGFMLLQRQVMYTTSYLLIPLMVMIRDERKVNKENAVAFGALMLALMLLPMWGESIYTEYLPFARIQIALLTLFVYMIIMAVRKIKKGKETHSCDVRTA